MQLTDIISKINNEMLHRYAVTSNHNTDNERVNISENGWNVQISSLKFSSNRIVNPHSHLLMDRGDHKSVAHEIWLVTNGSFKVTFYDIDCKTVLKEIIASTGFISISLFGCHSIQAISDNSTFLEIKNGPYVGKDISYGD